MLRGRMKVGNTDGNPLQQPKKEALQMDKCYIYMRVSTEAQVDGYSLDAQEERLEEYHSTKAWRSPAGTVTPADPERT